MMSTYILQAATVGVNQVGFHLTYPYLILEMPGLYICYKAYNDNYFYHRNSPTFPKYQTYLSPWLIT